MNKYIETLHDYKTSGLVSEHKAWMALLNMEDLFEKIEESNKQLFWDTMKDIHETFKGNHFNEIYAKHQVSKMFHIDHNGKKCVGEMYDLYKTEDVYMRYKHLIPSEYNIYDIYVAINEQGHNYICMFRNWHRDCEKDVLDEKIIESAISYWFKDEDYLKDGKIWCHFN